jgi:predicted MFS family arabinose efflux permease
MYNQPMNSPTALSQDAFSRLARTFSALGNPNYRLWFVGQLFSLIGAWTQNTAQGYLIYQLTDSAAYLGLVSFAAGAPTWLFTLYAGAIADRVSRRTMLITVQSVLMIFAASLAVLVFSGQVQPWHVLVLAVLSGTAAAFEGPARHSFVAELVERKDLANAISLNAINFNLAVVLGPALGGAIYALFGPGWCFTINTVSFLSVITALLLIRLAPTPPRPAHGAMLSDIMVGLRFVAANPELRMLMIGAAVVSTFGFGVMTLMPVWAVDILGGDVKTNGLLLSARGAGSIAGALLVASLAHRGIKGKIWLNSALITPLALLFFSQVRWLPGALAATALIGLGQMIYLNTTNALVQEQVSNELRGRVMGLYTLVLFGGMPLGSLVTGSLAQWVSPPLAVIFSAVLLVMYALLIRRSSASVRELH